jgi:hypothetical protein
MSNKKLPPEWMTEEQKEQWDKAFGALDKVKKKQSPANALTDAVIKYMKALNCATARINTTGIYDQKLGKYRYSGSTKGVEDVTCTMPVFINGQKMGVTIAVEVKIGKDKMSEDQKARKEAVETAGGHYVVAKTFDQFKIDIDNIVYEYRKFT